MSLQQSSLLEPSGEPAFVSAVDWITSTMLGSIAVALCTIAVAAVGLMMFEGRMPLRHGARVILGCFVIFGAPVIASGLMGAWQGEAVQVEATELLTFDPASDRAEPLPSNYDPYAGASLRRD